MRAGRPRRRGRRRPPGGSDPRGCPAPNGLARSPPTMPVPVASRLHPTSPKPRYLLIYPCVDGEIVSGGRVRNGAAGRAPAPLSLSLLVCCVDGSFLAGHFAHSLGFALCWLSLSLLVCCAGGSFLAGHFAHSLGFALCWLSLSLLVCCVD